MPERLKRQAREDGARRDKAEEVARGLLAKIEIGMIVEDDDGVLAALEDVGDALEVRLAENIKEAFRAGKQAAYELIAAIPPVTKAARAPAGLSDAEVALLEDGYLEPWRLRLEGEHRKLEIELTAVIAGQRKTGRSGEEVARTLVRDWEQRRRVTGAWQRAMVAAANALVGLADACGQESGYHGVGQ